MIGMKAQLEQAQRHRHDHAGNARERPNQRRSTTFDAVWSPTGNQGCDAVYRADGTAQVMIAVKTDGVRHGVVVAETDHQQADLLAVLGA
jgi:hypothetical protein